MTEQQKWREFEKEVGKEKAKAEVVKQLKQALDYLEKTGYPDIFSSNIVNISDDIFEKSFMATVSITLSYPWPG